MKNFFVKLSLILLMFAPSDLYSANKPLGEPQAIMAEIGKPGTVVIKVWSYNKSAKISDEQVFENAIKCILFKGIESDDSRRMKGRPAMIIETDSGTAEYFDSFFAKKEYLQYCSMPMEGFVEQGNLLKLKKGYKIGKIVVVQYEQLRKRLVADGIIRGLDSCF